jgi:hypothetical protein
MTSTPSAVPKHLNFITGNKNKLAEVRIPGTSKHFPLLVSNIARLRSFLRDALAWLHLQLVMSLLADYWRIMTTCRIMKMTFASIASTLLVIVLAEHCKSYFLRCM